MSSSTRHKYRASCLALAIAASAVPAAQDEIGQEASAASVRGAYVTARQAEGRDDPRFRVEDAAGVLRFGGHDALGAAADDTGLALNGPGLGGRLETRSVRCDAREMLGAGAPPEVDSIEPNKALRELGRSVREWYIDGPLGIEHGYDVAADACTGTLSVEIATPGFTPALVGQDVRLAALSGTAALRYGILFAADGEGRTVPPRCLGDASTVYIEVDAATARGPIVIDPLLYTEQISTTGADSASGDSCGVAVSVSGNTAIVGVAQAREVEFVASDADRFREDDAVE